MSDPRHESKKPETIGLGLVMPLLQKWVEIKLLLLEKLKQRIEDETDVDKTKALRAELNEVLLNDADIDQLDAHFTRINALVKKHKEALIEMIRDDSDSHP